MKKLLVSLVAACLLPFSALAIDFKEGVHYKTLNIAATAKPEVREYFSYYCPHCYKYEPLMQSVKAALKPGVKFEKNHVDFLPHGKPETAKLLTKALIAADYLNIEAQITNRIFQAIHVEKNRQLTESDIKGFFLGEGINEKKFASAFKNFSVEGQVMRMKQNQEKSQLTSVPTVIVNGKYKVQANKDIKSNQDYLDLVNYLTTLK
jgi:thiol:disulfide interchange protein DsbA